MAFIIYLLFIIYATYYDIITTENRYTKLTITPKRKVLSTFSVARNWEKLTAINNSSDRKFQSIQSIRFYNSLLVIFAHTSVGLLASPIANTKMTEQIYSGAFTTIAGNASLCMATFFFISSFIFSKNLFRKMDDKKEFTLNTAIEIIVKRFFRLIPTIAAVVLFNATWLHYLGNGPYWFAIHDEYQKCRKNGWSNILFLNKIVDPKNMCLLSSWYTAISTQYFILSLFFIWMLKKYEDYIWYILGAALSLTAFATFMQNYFHNYPSLLLLKLEDFQGYDKFPTNELFLNHYASFICNLSGPLVGIGFGYFLYKHEKENPGKNIFGTKFGIYIMLAMGIVMISCFAVPTVVILWVSNVHNRFWASVNAAMSKIVFVFSLGFLLLGFSENIGSSDDHDSRPHHPRPGSLLNVNLIKTFKELALQFVNWTPTVILSRLSYSAYLVQMSVIMLRAGTTRFPSYLSYFMLIATAFGDVVMVYLAALFLSLLIEMPFSALPNIFLVKEEKKKTQENGHKNK